MNAPPPCYTDHALNINIPLFILHLFSYNFHLTNTIFDMKLKCYLGDSLLEINIYTKEEEKTLEHSREHNALEIQNN